MICVKQMYSKIYYRMDLLFNFIVFMSLMGVDHFVFFDQGSASPQVYELWKAAAMSGVSIEILPWQYRGRPGWARDQNLVNEVCLYKAMYDGYENMLSIDIDEVIVPTYVDGNNKWNVEKHRSPPLISILDHLDQSHPNAFMYCFRDITFPHFSHGNDRKHHRYDLYYLQRTKYDNPLDYVDKCIYKPFLTRDIGIHWGSPVNDSFIRVNVSLDIARKHHYRDRSRIRPAPNVSSEYHVPEAMRTLLLNSDVYRNMLANWK